MRIVVGTSPRLGIRNETHEHDSIRSVFCCKLNILDTAHSFDHDRNTGRARADPGDVVPAQVSVDVRS